MVAVAGDYSGKPRPAVIVQSDLFLETRSITLCGLTSGSAEASLIRVGIDPTEENGLRLPRFVMADKIVTVPRLRLGRFVGQLTDADMMRVDGAIVIFLGLTPSPPTP